MKEKKLREKIERIPTTLAMLQNTLSKDILVGKIYTIKKYLLINFVLL
jgi:hypothetical protein